MQSLLVVHSLNDVEYSEDVYLPCSPFSLAACFAASETRKSCKMRNRRALPSSSGAAKIASITAAEGSDVMSAGCARNKKPITGVSDMTEDYVDLLYRDTGVYAHASQRRHGCGRA